MLDILSDAVLLRAAWMYDLPGYGLPIRGNFLLNLLTAAMRQETLRFSARDYRGITYVREAVERLTQAMELPGGVYNFGSENDCDMGHDGPARLCAAGHPPRRRGGRLAAQPADGRRQVACGSGCRL